MTHMRSIIITWRQQKTQTKPHFTFRVVGLYLLPDLQRSLAERFGLLVFAPLPVQNGQVVEGGGHSWVILPQSLLSDGQRVIQKVSCFFVLVLVPGGPNTKTTLCLRGFFVFFSQL